jgi:hypothetical protein
MFYYNIPHNPYLVCENCEISGFKLYNRVKLEYIILESFLLIMMFYLYLYFKNMRDGKSDDADIKDKKDVVTIIIIIKAIFFKSVVYLLGICIYWIILNRFSILNSIFIIILTTFWIKM